LLYEAKFVKIAFLKIYNGDLFNIGTSNYFKLVKLK